MAGKLAVQEVMNDLHELAKISNQSFLSEQERSIARGVIIRAPYYQSRSWRDWFVFFDTINRLSASSAVMKMLRTQIFLGVLTRFMKRPRLSGIIAIARSFFHLYWGVGFAIFMILMSYISILRNDTLITVYV